jgi:PD-(D/E)XK nuclease superfamily
MKTAMNGLADEADPRPSSPSATGYWTTRNRAANRRLFRLVAEVLAAVEAGVFPPRVGWHCADCPVRSRCWAWG